MKPHWSAWLEDLAEYQASATTRASSRIRLVPRVLALPRLQAVALFRLSQAVAQRSPELAGIVRMVTTVLTGADLSPMATVGGGLTLHHPSGVVVGPNCVVGKRCALMQGVTLGHGTGGSPRIEDDVFIGPHAVLIGGVTVGARANIGANSVVSFSVPAGAVVRAEKAQIRRVIADPQPGLSTYTA